LQGLRLGFQLKDLPLQFEDAVRLLPEGTGVEFPPPELLQQGFPELAHELRAIPPKGCHLGLDLSGIKGLVYLGTQARRLLLKLVKKSHHPTSFH
jgi:hypothetical protein